MRLTLFKIGIGLTILGMAWLAVIFFGGDRISEEFLIKPGESATATMNFEGSDIGYYKIFMPDFSGTRVFVQILDQNFNIVSDGIIQTKMSVGYFDFEGGTYSLKITNLSDKQVNLGIEFGDTSASKMKEPGIVTLAGGLLIVIAAYIKLRDYRIAQPDEKIS